MRTGESIEGDLVEIDDQCLILKTPTSEILIEADAIVGLEKIGDSPRPAGMPTEQATSDDIDTGSAIVLPSEAELELTVLEQRIHKVQLAVAAPDFLVNYSGVSSERAREIRSRLVAIKNSYAHSIKMKEPDRARRAITSLGSLYEAYRFPTALQIAGRIAWHMREPGAIDLLAEAADLLNDCSSCLDLAAAQMSTESEIEFAARTLQSCIGETTQPDDPALLGLLYLVRIHNQGKEELASLVSRASTWQFTEARKSVLLGGLLCVDRGQIVGFPTKDWNSDDLAGTAFLLIAQALGNLSAHGDVNAIQGVGTQPSPPADTRILNGDSRPLTQPAQLVAVRHVQSDLKVDLSIPVTNSRKPSAAGLDRLPLARRTTSSPTNEVYKLSSRIKALLNGGDLNGAETILDELKRFAPNHSMTWQATRDFSASMALKQRGPSESTSVAATEVIVDPKARDLMRRAETALLRKDLKQGIPLMHQAIKMSEEPPLAVRRFAHILATRLRKREEALDLLDNYKKLFVSEFDQKFYSQTRSTVLEHAGRWQEAGAELRVLLQLSLVGEERQRIIVRLAAALFKTFRYDDAKKLLEDELHRNPRQPTIDSLLTELIQAMQTGAYSIVEATLQSQVDITADLSPLLTFHLERCEYRGVSAESLASRAFTDDDIKKLDDLVSGKAKKQVIGRDFPRERADYNLSAARIMRDLGITDDKFRFRLRHFAAAMGDASALEGRSPDIVRAYYTEAISLKGTWDDLVDVKLRQLVTSFVYSDHRLLDMTQLPSLEQALKLVVPSKHLTNSVLVALLAIPTHAHEATSRLIRRIWADRETREIFKDALRTHLEVAILTDDQQAFTRAWVAAAEQDRNHRQVFRQFQVLTETPVLTAFDRHVSEIEGILKEVDGLISATDQLRIRNCMEVVVSLRQYIAQNKYTERERLFGTASRMIKEHLRAFESAPTVVSLEILHPYLRSLELELNAHWKTYDSNAAPQGLNVELVVNRYLPRGGKVSIQLQVTNRAGASPASNVELVVLPSNDYRSFADDRIHVAESIGAEESKPCQIVVVATRAAIEQQLLTLECQVEFTLRSQQRVQSIVEPKSIRLHANSDWAEIPNPYSAGLPVEDRAMFKGRDRLIGDLIGTVAGNNRGSVVVYGQKRAGKSSVLLHLKAALSAPDLGVSISIQDLAGGVSFGDLLYKISSEICAVLEDVAVSLGNVDESMPYPDIVEIRLAPQAKFIEFMRRLRAWMQRSVAFSDTRLVLLIDEFSMIHKEIHSGQLPSDFMKGWKATLERGFFRCVLVGNDLMPRFIEEFANEFQVARDARVSYLDLASAVELIEDPVRVLPDMSSRYRGDAVDRIVWLSGRNPYYIQLLCHDIVSYMNSDDVRGPVIGPADVEAVADGLVRTLSKSSFDNLLTPGDSEVADISDDLVMEVLRLTKADIGRNMYHQLDPNLHPNSEAVILDLERREVLELVSGNKYRIRVGLFSQWLQHRWS